jgi:fumarate reductase subunit C
MNVAKPYTKRVPVLWWISKWKHLHFIFRELTSLCVVFCSLELLYLVYVVSQGENAYMQFIEQLKSPWLTIANCFAFFGLLFHSYTWFNLAPKAMVVKIGKNTVPGALVLLANYAGWIVVSIVLIWILSSGQ